MLFRSVRAELEALAARLAARHAAPEEILVLREMVNKDMKLLGNSRELSRANRRFHKQLHLASHNRYLIQQLEMVHRTMALMATTTFAIEGRDLIALDEHSAIITALESRDGDVAAEALKNHISMAYQTRLMVDANQ